MTTVLSPQSRRPVLHRGYSCPSPRLPPAQYIAPSTPKWPAYVDDGNWQNAQAYNTFGDNYTSPPSGYGVGMNIMALALENQNMSWPADTGGFDSYLLAGWNGGSFVGSEAMSSGNNPQDATNLGFLNSGGADDSQSLSYAVAAMTAPSLMFASAATVFSEQSVLLEDARLNITVPQQNHNRITSQSPNLQDCSAHSASPMATFSPDCRSVQSNVKSSTKRKPGAVQKNRNWKVKSTKVKYSAGKVVGSEQVWVPDVRPSSTRTEEERQRIALNRLYGACPQHQEAHKPVCCPHQFSILK